MGWIIVVFAPPSGLCERANMVKSVIGSVTSYYPRPEYELHVAITFGEPNCPAGEKQIQKNVVVSMIKHTHNRY